VVLLLVVRRKRAMTGSGGKIELASESLAQKGAFFTENTPAAITDSPSTKKPSKSPTRAPITDEPTTAPVTGEPTRSPTYFPSDAPTNAPVTSKPKPTLMPSGSPVQAFCRRSGWTGRSRIPFRNGWWRPWFGRLLCGTLASPHLTETGWRRHFSTRKLCLRIVPATGSFRDVGCAGGMVVADAIIRRRPVFLRLT
jgi:hypothetical protein